MNEIITKIINKAEVEGLSCFGIRAESELFAIGEELPNSTQAGDTWDGEELEGTCALTINYDGFDVENIETDIEGLSQYLSDGSKSILIGGTSSYEGTDENEIVISEAKVLYVF